MDRVDAVRVEVGGRPTRMAYRSGGVDGGPAAVLVHGLGGSGRYLVPMAGHLAGDSRVWLPDLPGFGDSDDPPEVPDVPGLADALGAWMDALGIGPAALVGYSLGTQVVAELAARRPELASRLVLLHPTMDRAARAWLWHALRLAAAAPREPVRASFEVLRDFRKVGPIRFLGTFRHGLRHPIEERAGSVSAPALVVAGGRDPISPPRWAAEVAGALPEGRLEVVPGVGHLFPLAQPGLAARTVGRFLAAGHPAPAPLTASGT